MLKNRFHCFGASCQITLLSPEDNAEELFSLAKDEMLRLEAKFSSHLSTSLVSSINSTAGTTHVTELDPEARSLFAFVNAVWTKSKHVFDPTTCLLANCYSTDGRLQATPAQLSGMLNLVGWDKLEITAEGARLQREGMLIELDDCVRPYALDCLRKMLLARGIQHACLELDSEAVTIGRQPDGSNWLLGVRHPHRGQTAISRVKLNNRGFASCGEFERRIRHEGEDYGWGLSPVDGYPIPGLLSVSVLADSCLSAFGAAAVARSRTEQAAVKWLDNLGLPWMGVDRQLKTIGPLAPR
ncbi:hypothetical protein E4634_08325 [Mangrovimicrobium sediminis]|uniref:FAD:protein FMN transferase n=1 Tax=Mangrovimicrobium sediminis TaxID=2562682 RepID=A0A4Z0M424_9GAMM|nr:FAD:protein FMN transferase [Haliea sp. SAOS-164]TGD74128.1 hypothetical protein E4634_08325 [Haliea sp. SAOS-164]